jgi:hypothetical protein
VGSKGFVQDPIGRVDDRALRGRQVDPAPERIQIPVHAAGHQP